VKHLEARDWQILGASWGEKLWPKDLHLVLYEKPDHTLDAAAHVEPDDKRDLVGHGLGALRHCRNCLGPRKHLWHADYHVGTILFLNIVAHLPLQFDISPLGLQTRCMPLLR